MIIHDITRLIVLLSLHNMKTRKGKYRQENLRCAHSGFCVFYKVYSCQIPHGRKLTGI